MGGAQRRCDRHPVKKQRPLRFARQAPDQWRENDETHFEEDGQSDEIRCHEQRPYRAFAAELAKEPVGQHTAATRVFDESPDHGAQPDHDRDEPERLAESGLNGFQNGCRRHPRCKPQRHAGDEQRKKRVQLDHQNQEEQQRDRRNREDQQAGTGDRHESLILLSQPDLRFQPDERHQD